MIIRGSREEMERKAAWILAESIRQTAEERGRAIVGVPGGSSVGAVLDQLAGEFVRWERVHFFMVDERLVPLDHPDSNYRLVKSCVDSFMPEENLHPFLHDPEDPERGVEHYQRLLNAYGGRFDTVLLSSGEDGHVASLFPGHESISQNDDFFILTTDAPKPPPRRMSASRNLLCRAQAAVLLFFGSRKHAAFRAYSNEEIPVRECPARIVRSIPEHFALVDWQE